MPARVYINFKSLIKLVMLTRLGGITLLPSELHQKNQHTLLFCDLAPFLMKLGLCESKACTCYDCFHEGVPLHHLQYHSSYQP
jgi:hypothetical protein